MRELLFVSAAALLMLACGTTEDSVTEGSALSADSVAADVVNTDTSKAVTHSSPDQEKIDSLKQSKSDKKKK